MPDTSLIIASVSTGSFIDAACLAIVVTIAAIDAFRGFSSTLSALLGLLIAVHAGYWLYPVMRLAVGGTAFCRNHAQLGAILPYVLAVVVGGLIYAAVRFIFRRFFKLIVEQPVDNVLGAVAGVAKGMLVILLIFSCASLFPTGSRLHKIFHQDSRTGRCVVPVLRNVLQHSVPEQHASARPRKPRPKRDAKAKPAKGNAK